MAYAFQASHDLATLVKSHLIPNSVPNSEVDAVKARLKALYDPLRFKEVEAAIGNPGVPAKL